ncbi:MAG: lipoyl synthase [Candidatus Omnitrophica bacterium]|nr:lipoyl synthase [Candidatus Omnitrophota bacterium]
MNKFPEWVRKRIVISEKYRLTDAVIKKYMLNTVCTHARCPNIYECFEKNYATFMILGNVCTRACWFCSVNHYTKPLPADPDEPEKLAMAIKELGLKYVVITSVTRDDLSDGGAQHFSNCIRTIRKLNPETKIEPLIPDLKGNIQHLDIILDAMPDVFSHNIETVPSLYEKVRPQADYSRSLKVLKHAKSRSFLTKSAIMLGLGETKQQVLDAMKDLCRVGCDFLVIGQYLKPSSECIDVKEFVRPEVFEEYKIIGEKMGFKKVFSGIFCRSSYMAELALTGQK